MKAPGGVVPRERSGWALELTYATLPELFYTRVTPTRVAAPRLVVFNRDLADALGLDAGSLAGEDGAAFFSGNRLPPGADPIAQAYAGHQFGNFTTLGDGRAILLGEQVTPRGDRFDVQLKGSGPTPYSRRGDGRAALGPMLREYIISEAMHALAIPTTRSLAVAATGEEVFRQTVLPGAVLTRVAASHIRVGTFEWAAARGGDAAVRALVDYALRRHYPDLVGAENPARALLDGVVERQASLIAKWMLVGFVHGVMNTDNMAISGETIDYGPCAFLDAYDPATVFSSIDAGGRYAFGNQPGIAQWNLTRFAETILPLLDPVEERSIAMATEALGQFAKSFEKHWRDGLRRKLGLFNEEDEDVALGNDLLRWMQGKKADYTNAFAELSPERAGCGDDAEFVAWHARWRARLMRQPQSLAEATALRRAHAPAVIPRNHGVEAALAAAEAGDMQPLERLLEVLRSPFDHDGAPAEFRVAADTATGERYRTFCGT
jgi:uncharacterized protein YdiU (UPF0061 family)